MRIHFVNKFNDYNLNFGEELRMKICIKRFVACSLRCEASGLLTNTGRYMPLACCRIPHTSLRLQTENKINLKMFW